MLSKAVSKYINSLQIKKYRNLHQTFVVEGAKSVRELLASDLEIEKLFITEDFLEKHTGLLRKGLEYELVTENQLVQAGTYESNNAGLAIARMKRLPKLAIKPTDLVIALDDIRDPGNLGTIIRIADWYGINKIICSETCADFYNPKVIASTMGSFTRVAAYYVNLPDFLASLQPEFKIYGAAMEGENIHKLNLKPEGVLIMGNEANGLRPETRKYLTSLIKIPAFGKAESLNVATATAILVDNFFRQE
ncbi:RNA methyltransferase [Adhaeribacter sp. BT258]|uniref:RNA methyltransferase n=1 Tax=Adhaeribacter terrigena TaxID=2793070 RepID=A0ABS1C0J8_9BACT|nr:RNA methyltransferase [Adhaeribacter terrigena]MBK0402934.1 RNA methyltransferase [Adhaeribacter terrigena]